MPKEQIIVGLDVGTCFVRVVVAKTKTNQNKPQIIGISQVSSFGLRRGIVVDIEETAKSISQAVQEAERNSGVSIERVCVSLSGNHISPRASKGVVAVSRADGEVSREDVERAVTAASAVSLGQNREILHVIPRGFSLDSQNSIKDPVGMSGVRLEVDSLIIEGASPYIKNLIKAVAEAGVEIEELILSPLASSRAALNKRQKELGVLVLDLGGGTVGLTVFEEGDIIHSCILPIGSSHITNDIAIGLRSSIDLAEKVKLEYGSAIANEISKKDVIDLSKFDLDGEGIVPRIELVEIVEARLLEILDLVNKELKRIDRQGLLPAGAILVGGGAKMPDLVDLAKEELSLPVQIGFPQELDGLVEEADDPAFVTAVGLALWGLDKRIKPGRRGISLPEISVGSTVSKFKNWLRGFMP